MEETEIKRLKKKINAQIDSLIEKDKRICRLEEQVKTLLEENQKLSQETKVAAEKVIVSEDSAAPAALENDIATFFVQLEEIVKKIHEKKQFIPYKNATKYSGSFCKVERNVFDGYVNEVAQDAKKFMDNCKGFLCIKSENGKCVYNNDKIRVYFLNRQLVNMILGCSSGAEAPDDVKVV